MVMVSVAGAASSPWKGWRYCVNVRAAGNIAMDSVYAQSNGSVNIQSGGNLVLSATDIYANSGKASLQALRHINLEAAQESRQHETYRSGSDRSCFLFFCETTSWVNYHHNEYLLNKPVTVTAQDIEVKAGNNLNTYGTKFSSSRNLNLQAGDAINYFAVYDQKIETAKRDS